MLISDSRFDLIWFRLSCDHGWIRSGSVNVRKQQQQQQQPKPLLVYGSMLLLSTLILSSYSIIVVMLGYDWGLRMVINITCLKYQEVVLYLQSLNTLA